MLRTMRVVAVRNSIASGRKLRRCPSPFMSDLRKQIECLHSKWFRVTNFAAVNYQDVDFAMASPISRVLETGPRGIHMNVSVPCDRSPVVLAARFDVSLVHNADRLARESIMSSKEARRLIGVPLTVYNEC